jgi:hypothetical protein
MHPRLRLHCGLLIELWRIRYSRFRTADVSWQTTIFAFFPGAFHFSGRCEKASLHLRGALSLDVLLAHGMVLWSNKMPLFGCELASTPWDGDTIFPLRYDFRSLYRTRNTHSRATVTNYYGQSSCATVSSSGAYNLTTVPRHLLADRVV